MPEQTGHKRRVRYRGTHPRSYEEKYKEHDPLKYADTGIRETLKAMESKGAMRSRMTVKIAGGAKMFEVSGGGGLGNIESVHAILKRENIRLIGEYTGGNVARTMLFDVASGQACIRSYGQKDIIF